MQIDGRTLSHETSETIRHLAVRRVREGERPISVIASYGLCRRSIYRWLRAEKRGGDAALRARKHPGPKLALSPKQMLKVRHWINGKDSRQYGLDFGLWTRQLVAALIEDKLGVTLSVAAVGRLGLDGHHAAEGSASRLRARPGGDRALEDEGFSAPAGRPGPLGGGSRCRFEQHAHGDAR